MAVRHSCLEKTCRKIAAPSRATSGMSRKRIDDILRETGLSERAKDAVKTFSGGMKRRINIAAALLHRPKLLILDEPTVGVDPQSRNHIFEISARTVKGRDGFWKPDTSIL